MIATTYGLYFDTVKAIPTSNGLVTDDMDEEERHFDPCRHRGQAE